MRFFKAFKDSAKNIGYNWRSYRGESDDNYINFNSGFIVNFL